MLLHILNIKQNPFRIKIIGMKGQTASKGTTV